MGQEKRKQKKIKLKKKDITDNTVRTRKELEKRRQRAAPLFQKPSILSFFK